MDLLHITTTSTPPACKPARRRHKICPARKSRLCPKIATLSEKSFSLSDKRTMLDILLININNPIPPRLLPPPPFNRCQTPTPPAKTPIMPITTAVAHTTDITTSTLPSKNLCVSVMNPPSMEFGMCPVSLKFTTTQFTCLATALGNYARMLPLCCRFPAMGVNFRR